MNSFFPSREKHSLEMFLQACVWCLLHLVITVPGADVQCPKVSISWGLSPSMCPYTVTVDHKDWELHPGTPCSSSASFPVCLKSADNIGTFPVLSSVSVQDAVGWTFLWTECSKDKTPVVFKTSGNAVHVIFEAYEVWDIFSWFELS